jgi:ribose transport system ATP-binding protein
MAAEPLLAVAGLSKSYASPVLVDVSMDLHAGEVHGLVGENGAGKSTLSKIIAGFAAPDEGVMRLCGEPYSPSSKVEAETRGVAMVLQEPNLIGSLEVGEQLLLNGLPRRFGFINRSRLRREAREMLARVGLDDLDPGRQVAGLGVGQQQMVAVAAGLSHPRRLLILDEPTSALTVVEAGRLFAQIERLKALGTAVLYISHRLEEVLQLADRITVLRDGRVVTTRDKEMTDLSELMRLMVGRPLEPASVHQRRRSNEEPALIVRNLRRGGAVRNISFELFRGEIMGIAGLMGSGRTETVRALFGADRAEAGDVGLPGRRTSVPFRSPRDAIRHGLALVTENRKEEGLLLPLSILANLTLPRLRDFARGGVIRRRAEAADAASLVQALRVTCVSLEQPVAQLSGGNQQKVVLARWLSVDPDILICDEPTRGVDVGARLEIHRLLKELADAGKAVLVVSSDLDELLSLCDRIAVLSKGRIVGTFERGGVWSQDAILAAALSGHTGRAGAA